MLCDKCHKNTAVTHIKTVVNGIVYEKHLCEDCADGEVFSGGFENPFSQLINSVFEAKPLKKNNVSRCAACGSTLRDILNSGKLGCPKCYEAFEEQLIPYIKRLQGSDRHKGKGFKPESAATSEKSETDSDISKLQKELEKAVGEERFEDAAGLRDRINELKNKKDG